MPEGPRHEWGTGPAPETAGCHRCRPAPLRAASIWTRVDGQVSRPWRRGPPQRVIDPIEVVLDEVVRDRQPKVWRRVGGHAVQATQPCVSAVAVKLASTDAVSMLEVLDPAGARFEFIFGDLELLCHLLGLIPYNRVSQLHFFVATLVKPFGKLRLNLWEL
ncbi:hypothetical protein BGW80DRAFT_472902 [Lactifluus volemus]|nr:hypothetical protein BGW80DRAFT_472902 [Lactifluus volemus]